MVFISESRKKILIQKISSKVFLQQPLKLRERKLTLKYPHILDMYRYFNEEEELTFH